MRSIAKFLREKVPGGFPPIILDSLHLAQMLDDAAQSYRGYVDDVSRHVPGQVKWTRQSSPHHVFISLISNSLRKITGRWLDHEVAVLTEIAFNVEIGVEQVRWVRHPRSRRARR